MRLRKPFLIATVCVVIIAIIVVTSTLATMDGADPFERGQAAGERIVDVLAPLGAIVTLGVIAWGAVSLLSRWQARRSGRTFSDDMLD